MKRKSSKRKKPRCWRGSWLADIGTFLAGIAAVCEVAFKVAVFLMKR